MMLREKGIGDQEFCEMKRKVVQFTYVAGKFI
jgi:hypothetical protein